MARRRDVERAKQRFVAETENRDWVLSVGIGDIDGKLGLIINVRLRTKPAASRLLNRLKLGVPTRVRAVEDIHARTTKTSENDSELMRQLRTAAASRLNKR